MLFILLKAILGSVILLLIYKFINEEDGDCVDFAATFGFILIPTIVIVIISLVLAKSGTNPSYALFGYILYFLLPFFWLKSVLEFSNKSALKFSIAVPIVAILSEVVFFQLISKMA